MRQASTVYIQNFVEQNTQNGASIDEMDLQIINAKIMELDFPVGWGFIKNEDNVNTWQFWFIKTIGWLITAGAGMQGAPFWFDVLKKITSTRSSSTKTSEKSEKEETSDKER
jgi:hypothetical protein